VIRNGPKSVKHCRISPVVRRAGNKKTPTDNSWGFVFGGGDRNRTRVRKTSTISSTCLANSLVLVICYPSGRKDR